MTMMTIVTKIFRRITCGNSVMAVIRPVWLLVGLIGSGSVFVGIAFQPTMPPSFAAGSAALVGHEPRTWQTSFSLDPVADAEAVLVITSGEAPRRQSRITIGVEAAGDRTPVALSWQPLPMKVPARSQLLPRVITNDDAANIVAVPSSPRCEQWFLPGDASGRERNIVVQSIEVAESPRVRVVLDQQWSDDVELRGRCRELAARMNTAWIPAVEAVFGPIADRQESGQLTIVATPRVRQMTRSQPPIDAFVLATDYREELIRPMSNECDAIYVHPELVFEPSDAVLIHELTHVAQFCAFRRQYGTSPWPLADWMLEGSAHATELLLTGNSHNVQDRLHAFYAAPELSPLRVQDSAREKLWRDPRCRGAACSFFTWFGHQYGMDAVGQMITRRAESENVWRVVTGKNCEELVRDWQASLIVSRAVRQHEIQIGRSITLTIQGGATAFVRLPNSIRMERITVRMQAPDSSPWTSWVHRHEHTTSPEGPEGDGAVADYCGIGVALTSPVTTIR